MLNNKKILLAPLDWGLGHTTRIIPIIKYLLDSNCHVTLAASGTSKLLLENNFKELMVYEIPGYNTHYNKKSFFLSILSQLPKFFSAINKEKRWLQSHLLTNDYDLIISDNRYGFRSKNVKSIILTHQVGIISGLGKWVDKMLLNSHLLLLNKFNATWIVDNPEVQNSIALNLSHPQKLPKNHQYIGLLSQFTYKTLNLKKDKKPVILILLSGPEPQRTELEHILINQTVALIKYHFIIVTGSTKVHQSTSNHVTIKGLCTFNEIEGLLADADLVICRSGYSTIMDLINTKKKALIIPTPGQTEQEYIAKRLMARQILLSVAQSYIQLNKHLKMAMKYPGFEGTTLSVNEGFQTAIEAVLQSH